MWKENAWEWTRWDNSRMTRCVSPLSLTLSFSSASNGTDHSTLLQLFEAQDLAQKATQAILAFIRKSIETRYGATGAPPPAAVKLAPKEEEMKELSEKDSEDGDDSMDDA